MRRKPANERASERIPIGAPATLKFAEQELTGFVEVVNVAGMYVATHAIAAAADRRLRRADLLVAGRPAELPRPRQRRVSGRSGPAPGARRPGFGARFERPPVTLLDAIRNLNRGH